MNSVFDELMVFLYIWFFDQFIRTLNMEDFKRVYSNNDTKTVALPYFWKNFDKENYSIWYSEYKYPEDLKLIFMSCNLVTGQCRTIAFG